MQNIECYPSFLTTTIICMRTYKHIYTQACILTHRPTHIHTNTHTSSHFLLVLLTFLPLEKLLSSMCLLKRELFEEKCSRKAFEFEAMRKPKFREKHTASIKYYPQKIYEKKKGRKWGRERMKEGGREWWREAGRTSYTRMCQGTVELIATIEELIATI